MKKILILLVIIFLALTPLFFNMGYAADKNENKGIKVKTAEIEYETADKFLISATLTYPKEKGKIYPVIILLHSIGMSSKDWGTLPQQFNEAGFAVLSVDLRGHGKSVYNINLDKKYWQHMSLKAFAKYPKDVAGLMEYVQQQHKNVSFANYAIVGADIGANTAVLAAQKMKIKPFALVLISPQTSFKDLYIPVALADLISTDVLFIYSKKDIKTVNEVRTLKRFAQEKVLDMPCESGGSGMTLIKTSPKSAIEIVNWCVAECNNYIDMYTKNK